VSPLRQTHDGTNSAAKLHIFLVAAKKKEEKESSALKKKAKQSLK
jgi:hypothetical protein